LAAYYPFSGNVLDSSGNGNNGTIHTGVTGVADKSGIPNRAYNFDGTTNAWIDALVAHLLTQIQ
jgi:hypothetical protein